MAKNYSMMLDSILTDLRENVAESFAESMRTRDFNKAKILLSLYFGVMHEIINYRQGIWREK
jgi:hypothetical protein